MKKKKKRPRDARAVHRHTCEATTDLPLPSTVSIPLFGPHGIRASLRVYTVASRNCILGIIPREQDSKVPRLPLLDLRFFTTTAMELADAYAIGIVIYSRGEES